MNVHRGYEGARNEAFLSLHSRRVPRTTDDPPPPFVTMTPEQGLQNSPPMRPLHGPPITQFGFTYSSHEPQQTDPLFKDSYQYFIHSAPETSQSSVTVTTDLLPPTEVLSAQTVRLRTRQIQISSNIPPYSLSSGMVTTPVRTSPVNTVRPATTVFSNRDATIIKTPLCVIPISSLEV